MCHSFVPNKWYILKSGYTEHVLRIILKQRKKWVYRTPRRQHRRTPR